MILTPRTTPTAPWARGCSGEKSASGIFLYISKNRVGKTAAKSLKPRLVKSAVFTKSASGVRYYGFRYYNPQTGRWISRDPLSEHAFWGIYTDKKSLQEVSALIHDSLDPVYAFVGNNSNNSSDFLGLAYMAYRPLKNTWFVVASPADEGLNTVVGHEQLFFEDGKSPANIGYDGSLFTESDVSKYRGAHDSGWNDCVMRKAIQNVPLGSYCLLGKPGPKEKFNCQDWVEAVRVEYRKLIQTSAVVGACCPTDKEKNK